MSEPKHELAIPGRGERWTLAADRAFDRVFGAAANPLRHLGALGFHLFWIVAASGTYVYVFYDTSVAGAWDSMRTLHETQPWLGGMMRSVHRYAADALVLVAAAHLLREWMLGRFRGFRWFTWVSGVPLLWLLTACGLIGFWLAWDRLAAWVAVASLEWLAALPGVGSALVRNAVVEDSISDRLFSLLIFLHIGVSLLLLLGMWIHVQRLARPSTRPARRLAIGSLVGLVLLALVYPAPLLAPADLLRIDARLPLDWFFMAALPVASVAPFTSWVTAIALTAVLIVLPWLPGAPKPAAAARVDPANCNGCTRCFADCPYGAVVMVARGDGRSHQMLAQVDPDLCAGCGICVGACPSATPFRSVDELVSGIDMPDLPLQRLRGEMSTALRAARTLVFRCARAADGSELAAPGVAVLSLTCAGQLPPAFLDFALRNGADAVVVASCTDAHCAYRLGAAWTRMRLIGQREPRLRAGVDAGRVLFVAADHGDEAWLSTRIEAFHRASGAPDQPESPASFAGHA